MIFDKRTRYNADRQKEIVKFERRQITQIITDALCAKFADGIGYRQCAVAAETCSAAGLVGLAFLPGERRCLPCWLWQAILAGRWAPA